MTDERPFVSNAEQRRHEHLSASKPTSADRVSDRLNELTAENERLEQEVRDLQAELLALNVRKAEAEARKPYADKIMALEQQIGAMGEKVKRMEADKEVLFGQVEHTTAQLHTARAERNDYQDKLRHATLTLRTVRELTLPF